jgi:hypothetical protein
LYALKSFVPDVDLSGMDQKKQAPKNKAKPTRQIASDIKDTIIEEVQVAKPRVRSSSRNFTVSKKAKKKSASSSSFRRAAPVFRNPAPAVSPIAPSFQAPTYVPSVVPPSGVVSSAPPPTSAGTTTTGTTTGGTTTTTTTGGSAAPPPPPPLPLLHHLRYHQSNQ